MVEWKLTWLHMDDFLRFKRFAEIENRSLVRQFRVLLDSYEADRPILWDSRDRENIARMLEDDSKGIQISIDRVNKHE